MSSGEVVCVCVCVCVEEVKGDWDLRCDTVSDFFVFVWFETERIA